MGARSRVLGRYAGLRARLRSGAPHPALAATGVGAPPDYEIDPAVHASLLGAYWLMDLTAPSADPPSAADRGTDPPWWESDTRWPARPSPDAPTGQAR